MQNIIHKTSLLYKVQGPEISTLFISKLCKVQIDLVNSQLTNWQSIDTSGESNKQCQAKHQRLVYS